MTLLKFLRPFLFQPALTTVRQDIAAGASALVDTVIAASRGEKPASVVLAPSLIVRASA